MSTNMSQDPEKNIEALGRGEAPVLEQLAQMTIDTRARSGLDDETFTLVRIAALVASDAAPASYLLNLGAAANGSAFGGLTHELVGYPSAFRGANPPSGGSTHAMGAMRWTCGG